VGILLDSSVLIAAERIGQNPHTVLQQLLVNLGDSEATMSVVTVVELAHGIARAGSTSRRITRESFLNELLKELSVEPITVPIAFRAGKLDGQLQEKGIAIALADLLIGTTALELGYAVATRNLRHFRRIPGLVVREL